MQTSILKLEVRHKQKHVATVIRHSNEDTLIIGQAKKAHLKLFNAEVSPMHAVVHHNEHGWWIRDLGSVGGTWVNKKSVIEHELHAGQQIRIGQHDIFITTYQRDPSLFALDKKATETGKAYHQVVLKHNKKLYRTHLLSVDQKFIWKGKEFPAPLSKDFISSTIDGYTIEQRLIHVADQLTAAKEKEEGLTREAILATSTVGVLFAIFLVISLFSFTKPDIEVKLPEAKTAKFIPLKTKHERFVPMDAAAGAASAPAPQQGAAKMIASNFSAVLGRVTQRLSKASINLQRSGTTGSTTANSAAALGMTGTSKEGVAGLVGKIGGQGNGSGTAVQVMGGGGVAGIGQMQQGSLGTGQVGALEEESEVMGGLDKEVIAKIIRSYLGQIRYCYERQLSATPDLYGKLLVQFSIGQTGGVNTQSILSSSLQNKNVEGCVLKQVANWKFPEPKGGTIVKVSYPFLFTSTK